MLPKWIVLRYSTSNARTLIILIITSLRPSVYSRCYSFRLSDPPPLTTTKRRGSMQLRCNTTTLCPPAVAEPENLWKIASWTCFPRACLDTPQTVYEQWTIAWPGDSCGLLRWSDCEWSIRFVARDQKRIEGTPSFHLMSSEENALTCYLRTTAI